MKTDIVEFVFRMPFLAIIPEPILSHLDTSELYLPQASSRAEQVRIQLQDALDCYVVTYNSTTFTKAIPLGRRLSDNVKGARLTKEQKLHLLNAENDLSADGVSFVAYAKPLEIISPEDSSLYWSKNRVTKVLKGQMLAVISTSHLQDSTPESAVVAFAEDEALCLFFQTRTYTRKFRNIQFNPKVSFVIGFDVAEQVTIQYEGIAMRLITKSDIEECKRRLTAKGSHTTPEYLNHPEAALFKVTPTWIRYSNFSDDNPGVSEISLDPKDER